MLKVDHNDPTTPDLIKGGHQPEKSGNLKVVRENMKSQENYVLAFGVLAVTLFNDY